jgi:hypothetical protein
MNSFRPQSPDGTTHNLSLETAADTHICPAGIYHDSLPPRSLVQFVQESATKLVGTKFCAADFREYLPWSVKQSGLAGMHTGGSDGVLLFEASGAMQLVASLLPWSAKCQRGHGVHIPALEAPVAFENVAYGHNRQADVPCMDLYVPGAHCRHWP